METFFKWSMTRTHDSRKRCGCSQPPWICTFLKNGFVLPLSYLDRPALSRMWVQLFLLLSTHFKPTAVGRTWCIYYKFLPPPCKCIWWDTETQSVPSRCAFDFLISVSISIRNWLQCACMCTEDKVSLTRPRGKKKEAVNHTRRSKLNVCPLVCVCRRVCTSSHSKLSIQPTWCKT